MNSYDTSIKVDNEALAFIWRYGLAKGVKWLSKDLDILERFDETVRCLERMDSSILSFILVSKYVSMEILFLFHGLYLVVRLPF